jgi:hypothetical protein
MRLNRNGQRPTFTNKAARSGARKVSDIDVVRWLAEHPEALDEVKYIADQIVNVIVEELPTPLAGSQAHRLADHFWLPRPR